MVVVWVSTYKDNMSIIVFSVILEDLLHRQGESFISDLKLTN